MKKDDKQNPLVSVWLLVYNNHEEVAKSVEGIMAQTYDNIQVIISDDGSNNYDSSVLLGYREKIEKRFPNVKIFCNEINVGTVKHLNKVIKESDGIYMMPCSSGDVFYDKDTVKKTVDYMVKKDALFLAGRHEDTYLNGDEVIRKKIRPAFFFPILFGLCPGLMHKYMLNVKNVISGCAVCYSRGLFDKYGCFDEQYRLLEDFPYYLMLLEKGEKIHFKNRPFVKHMMGGVSNGQVNPLVLKDLEKLKENYKLNGKQ